MQTMSISLPERLKDFIDSQVESGGYSSVSEYIRELIRHDEERKGREKLETLLLEGLRGGDPAGMTRQDWDDFRRETLRQFETRKSRRTA